MDTKTPDKRVTVKSSYTLTEKVIKTIFLVITWVAIGLFTEITGPTQKDLIIKTDSDYEYVSRAISGRSVGYFIGAFIGGPLVDKLGKYCDLLIAISLDGAAIATVIAPYATDVNLLWFLFVLDGTFEGVINIAGQKLILDLWKEKATGPLHVLHFGFGMGSFLVPQIANPFLAVLAPETTNITTTTQGYSTSLWLTTSTTMNTSHSQSKYIKQSRIESAFLIVAIIVAALSIAFYIYQFCCRMVVEEKVEDKKPESNFRKIVKVVDPGTCANGDRVFGVQVFFLLCLYFFNVVGGERTYGKFIRSYAIDKHNFSGDDASLLNTAFWISFSIGRFIGLFTGRFIPIRILLLIEVCGAFLTAILLDIFARDSDLALWVLTVVMGFFVAPLFPSGIGWGDFHVEFTGFAITFVLMGGAIGGMSYLWVIGYLYQNKGYDMFLHQMVVYGGLLSFFAIMLTIVGKRHGGRFENIQTDLVVKDDTKQSKSNKDIAYITGQEEPPPYYNAGFTKLDTKL